MQTGVRQPVKLKSPKASLLKDIELPKNSYLHFTEQNQDAEITLGIEKDNPFLILW